MTYGRLSKPRFYMDNVNWQFSRGLARSSALSMNTGTFVSGYDIYQLFDMNPQNYAQFNVSAGSTVVSVEIDFGFAVECDFISVLNHDLADQGGAIRVAYSASPMSVGGGTGVGTPRTVYVNGSYVGGNLAPDQDGDSLAIFASATARYWVVEFVPDTTWAGNLTIGQIVLGKYWTSPVSPDMPVTKSTAFEGVTVRKSYGGKSFATAGHITANVGDYAPFRVDTTELAVGGRESFDFSIGFIEDDELYPSDRSNVDASDNFLGDVVTKCSMNFLPFIFAADSTSTTAGDYLWARFDQNSFESVRKGWQVESLNLRVVQEF